MCIVPLLLLPINKNKTFIIIITLSKALKFREKLQKRQLKLLD